MRGAIVRLGARAVALAVLVLAAVAPAANATDWCNGNGDIVRMGAEGVYVGYVAVDPPGHEYIFSVWVYAETNGMPDVQRGGVSPFGDADVCQDSDNPDQLIF